VPGILTQNPDHTSPTEDFALWADRFDRWFDLHDWKLSALSS